MTETRFTSFLSDSRSDKSIIGWVVLALRQPPPSVCRFARCPAHNTGRSSDWSNVGAIAYQRWKLLFHRRAKRGACADWSCSSVRRRGCISKERRWSRIRRKTTNWSSVPVTTSMTRSRSHTSDDTASHCRTASVRYGRCGCLCQLCLTLCLVIIVINNITIMTGNTALHRYRHQLRLIRATS